MNPLQKKLKEIQGKYGQDVFLDEGRLAAELKLHFTITKKSVEPVLWCARNFVYFKAYADQDSDHLWFYRYSLLQQMKRELDVPRQDAEEAVDAWIGLAGQHKKAEGLQSPDAAREPLYKDLLSARRGFEAGMEEEAIQKLLSLSTRLPLAFYYTGRCFLEAQDRQEAKAVDQFTEGAKSGDRDCLDALGDCLLNGWGVQASEEEAIARYVKAAQALQPHALFLVGVLYDEGYGAVEKNPMRSLYYLSWAARQGNRDARDFLAVYYKQENEHGQVTNAYPFFTQETVNLADAYFAVAQIYDTGKCLVKDESKARRYYMAALEHGSDKAAKVVEERYERQGAVAVSGAGDGVADEKTEALLRLVATQKDRAELQNAATAGDTGAQYSMGISYLNGIGFEKNLTVALSWFRRGAAQGDAECEKMVYVCNYYVGLTYGDGAEPAKAIKGVPFWKKALEHPEYLDENMKCDCYFRIACALYEAEAEKRDAAQAAQYMGYPLAQNYLKAHLYMARAWAGGTAGGKDPEKALTYYLSAFKIAPDEVRPILESAYEENRAQAGALSDGLRAEIEQALAQPV